MSRKSRRAVWGVLVTVVVAASLGSCTRPGSPWWRPTTTTTTAGGGAGAKGRYAEPVFANFEQVATAVTYKPANAAEGLSSDLKLDAWAPAGDTATRRPAIVWGFGGAWVGGARSMMSNYAQDSARRGYVGITIDYRLQRNPSDVRVGEVPAYMDTIAAGEWLKANADRYQIDPDAIVVGGFSAGALNAINAVTLPGAPLPELPAGFIPSWVRNPDTTPYAAAISNSGGSLGRSLAGTRMFPRVAEPRSTSRPGEAPIIMFAGTADVVADYQLWQQPACDDHKAAGNVCEWVSYQGESHGVFGKLPDLLNRSAAFVKQRVLVPKGYTD
jgi:acetyl esterase/lipase